MTTRVLVLVVVCVAVGGARAELIDRVLAVVAGDVITQSDVRAAMAFGLVQTAGARDPVAAALDRLIERRLMLLEVERYAPPDPEPLAIERQVTLVRERVGGEAVLARIASVTGMTEARLRAHARNDLRIQAYVDQRFAAAAQPTDEEVAAYYRSHQAEFTRAGVVSPLAEVERAIRDTLLRERRRALIRAWIEGLRRRTEITSLYLATR